jgi:hypothetical protein
VRIAVAAVLAAAADAVLVAHHLPKLGAHLVTARPVEEMPGGRKHAGDKRRERRGRDAAAAGDKKTRQL